jgi:hypothetical protein
MVVGTARRVKKSSQSEIISFAICQGHMLGRVRPLSLTVGPDSSTLLKGPNRRSGPFFFVDVQMARFGGFLLPASILIAVGWVWLIIRPGI